MEMGRLHLALFILFFIPNEMMAQFDQFGTFLGVSAYSGDLSERSIEPLEINFAAGIYVRKKISKRFETKYFAYRGFVSGNDAHSTAESRLWVRNLRFESEIYEIGGLLEYSLLVFDNDFYQGSPYVFLGISAFYFNPITELDGKHYELHRFQTEGVAYTLFQPAIPFGAGVKMSINEHGSFGLELGFRKTFTDYLDDVSNTYADFSNDGINGEKPLKLRLSYRTPEVLPDAPKLPMSGQQRGNPEKNDWFMYFGISVGIYLK